MTREEAIRWLNIHKSTNVFVDSIAEAIDMAIEALSANAVQGEWGHMIIDGNKLMLALSEWWYSSFGLEETEESKAIHKVMDEVERYVDHEKSADYWTPCSERLPSEDGCYLVSTTGTNNDLIDIAYYTEEIWHKASRIKAWMPLPKPYREESEVEE